MKNDAVSTLKEELKKQEAKVEAIKKAIQLISGDAPTKKRKRRTKAELLAAKKEAKPHKKEAVKEEKAA